MVMKISKEIKTTMGDLFVLGEGTLYPALKRLEDKKLLEFYWEKVDKKDLKRKYYKITKDGISELKSKLESWKSINLLIEKFLIKGILNND